jgi:hypothetical protein
MTERKVEEALEGLLTQRADDSDGYDDDAFFLAPHVEKALRAAAREMADVLVVKPAPEVFDQCVTAGVAAMMEKGTGS